MTEKEIMLEIDGIIKKTPNLRTRSEFCRKTGRTMQSFNQMLNGVVDNDKTMWVNSLLAILDDLGYEVALIKKQK